MSDQAMFLASIAGSTDADQTRHFRENVQRMGVIPVADAVFRPIVRSSFPTRHRESLNRIGTIQTLRRPERPRPTKNQMSHPNVLHESATSNRSNRCNQRNSDKDKIQCVLIHY